MENLQENENNDNNKNKIKDKLKYILYNVVAIIFIFTSIFSISLVLDLTVCDNLIKTIHIIVYFVFLIAGVICARFLYISLEKLKYARFTMYFGLTLYLICSYFAFNFFIRIGEEYKENACIIEQNINSRGGRYNKLLFKSGGVIEINDYELYDKVDVGGIVSVTLQKGVFGTPVCSFFDDNIITISDSSKIYSMRIDKSKSYYDNGLLCEEAGAYNVAHKYYNLSWEKGKNGYALWRLGRFYEEGLGVEKNLLTAYNMYFGALNNDCKIARKDANRVKGILKAMGYK